MSETRAELSVWNFTPQARGGSLRGFVDVELSDGLILVDLALHTNPDRARWWILHPGRALLDRDGVVVRNGSGIAYERTVNFTSRNLRWDFSRRVVDALRASNPEVFQ